MTAQDEIFRRWKEMDEGKTPTPYDSEYPPNKAALATEAFVPIEHPIPRVRMFTERWHELVAQVLIPPGAVKRAVLSTKDQGLADARFVTIPYADTVDAQVAFIRATIVELGGDPDTAWLSLINAPYQEASTDYLSIIFTVKYDKP